MKKKANKTEQPPHQDASSALYFESPVWEASSLVKMPLFFTTRGQSLASICAIQASAPTSYWGSGEQCLSVLSAPVFADFPMQLNLAIFEFNGRTGYLLKHDVLRRGDKKFDPFCDRIDTVVASTLTIKACSSPSLSPTWCEPFSFLFVQIPCKTVARLNKLEITPWDVPCWAKFTSKRYPRCHNHSSKINECKQ